MSDLALGYWSRQRTYRRIVFFRRRRHAESRNDDGPSIHIHEEFWGMRNLYPLEAAGDVARDMDVAIDASLSNRAPDGYGWTAMHIIEAPAYDYAAAGLSLERVSTCLSALMPRVRRFNATAGAGLDGHDPMGSYETDAYCFGFDASCYVKVEPSQDAGGIARAIWFECQTPDVARQATLRRALESVDAIVPSVIAACWLARIGPLSDPAFLDSYVAEINERCT